LIVAILWLTMYGVVAALTRNMWLGYPSTKRDNDHWQDDWFPVFTSLKKELSHYNKSANATLYIIESS